MRQQRRCLTQCSQNTDGRRKYETRQVHTFLSTIAPSPALTSRTIQSRSLSRSKAVSSPLKESLFLISLPSFHEGFHHAPVQLDLDGESKGAEESDFIIPTLKQCVRKLPTLGRSLHSLQDIFTPGNILWCSSKIQFLH